MSDSFEESHLEESNPTTAPLLRRSQRNPTPAKEDDLMVKLVESETETDEDDVDWEEGKSVLSDTSDEQVCDNLDRPPNGTGNIKKRVRREKDAKIRRKTLRLNQKAKRRKIDDVMSSLASITEKNAEILKLLLENQQNEHCDGQVAQTGTFRSLAIQAGQMVTSHLIHLSHKDKKRAYKKYKEVMGHIFNENSENQS